MTLLDQYIADYQRVCAEKVQLQEQLDAARETFRLIAMACGEDGTEPEDWRALAHPGHAEFALNATRDLRDAYDEVLMASNPAKERD